MHDSIFHNYQNDLLKQTKRKNKVKLILMMLLLLIFLINTFISSLISPKIIIFSNITDNILIISVLFSLVLALSRKVLLSKHILVRIKNYLLRFINSFLCYFIPTFILTEDMIYLMQGEYKIYITKYKITSSGPSIAKFSYCNNGIEIFDKYTSSNFFLCFRKNENFQYGNKALVAIKTTPFGSYLSDYKLFIQH